MKRVLPFLSFIIVFGLGWLLTPRLVEKSAAKATLSSRSLRDGPSRTESEELERVREIDRQTTHEEKIHQLIALASSIPVGEIADWHRSEFIDALDDDLESLFFRITSERWLENNPREFMEWANMMNYRQADLHLAQWAVKDPEAANDFIKRLPLSDRSDKISKIIPEIAKTNPDLAFEFLGRNVSSFSDHSDYYFKKALGSLAKDHLEALLAARETWPKAARDQASTVIAEVFLRQDFTKGLSFLQDEGLDWKAIVQSGNRKIAATLIENRDQLPDGWLDKILRQSPWAFTSAANGIELLESDPESLGVDPESFARLLGNADNIFMNKENRGRVMAVINGEIVPLKNRQTILRSKIVGWNQSDSDGLRNWLGTLDDPDLHAIADQALEQFDQRTDTKPSAEGDLAKVVGPERLDYSAIRRINRWTPAETGKALEAFRKLSIEEQRVSFESARNSMGYEVSNFDFFKEIFTEASKFPPSDNQNARSQPDQALAFQSFSNRYAGLEPTKAAEWASQLAPGAARRNAIQGVAKTWKNYSPSEAEAWIQTLPAADQEAAKKVLE